MIQKNVWKPIQGQIQFTRHNQMVMLAGKGLNANISGCLMSHWVIKYIVLF